MNLTDELAAADKFIDGRNALPPGHTGIDGLSRHDALQRTIVLMRLLRATVTTSHHHMWQLCAADSDRRWSEIDPTASVDTFHCSAAVLFGMLVPPQTEIDALVRHTLLGPLAFVLIEGILRRGSGGHLRDDGSVARPFTITCLDESYSPTDRTHCSQIGHALLLQGQLFAATQPTTARAFEALQAEMRSLLGVETVWRELDHWRDEWLHRSISNQVPILATLLAFLVIAQMTDRDYADAIALMQRDERAMRAGS